MTSRVFANGKEPVEFPTPDSKNLNVTMPEDPDIPISTRSSGLQTNDDGEEGYPYSTEPDVSSDDATYNVVQLRPKSLGRHMVPGIDISAQSYTLQSDISYTMDKLMCDEPDDTAPTDADKMSFFANNIQTPMKCDPPPKLKLDIDLMFDLVRTSSVPVVMCVATLTGLSPERKSALFQDFVKIAVKFKDDSSELATRYRADLKRRCFKEGLSSFQFNILGEFPFRNLMWLLGTKRSNISLCFLCCLLQALKLRKINIDWLETAENDFNVRENELLGKKHGEWLFYEATKRLKALKECRQKLDLLEPGVTLLNVFNIGSSKAAYNFLPFLGQHCKRSLPLFFVSDKDSTKINKPVVTDECETDVSDLINAYVARKFHDPRSMSVGKSEKHYDLEKAFADNGFDQPNFQKIDLSNMEDTKKILEKMVVKNMSKYVTGLPVRWVFLRSLLQALNISLMTKSDIIKLAASSDAGIDSSEVEAFLTTFTSFASLLYIPSLTDVVLVDIERFTDCLDKVFRYRDSSDACSFGFIPEAVIDQLAEAEKLDADLFKAVLKAFRFGFSIATSKVDRFKYEEVHYYMIPSMRPSEGTNGPLAHSLYLQNSSTIPGNIQVLLVNQVLEHSNCYLVPSMPINTSVVRVKYRNGKEDCVDVTIIDHKDVVEFRLKEGCSAEAYETACFLIVQACDTAMINIDPDYHFMVRGVSLNHCLCRNYYKGYHIMTDDNSIHCTADSSEDPAAFHKHWKNAVSKLDRDKDSYKLELLDCRK